jgi:hypothetical protein
MSSNYIFFTGAPEASSLNWDEEYLLPSSDPGLIAGSKSQSHFDGGNDEEEVQWRVLPLEHQRLKSGLMQSFETPVRDGVYYPVDGKDTSFFTTTSFSFIRDNSEAELGSEASSSAESEGILSQFYDHSLAVHEELPSSLISLSQSTVTDSYVESSVDAGGPETASASARVTGGQGQHKSSYIPLTDLKTIPNASHLSSLEPQTVTVNLIVGIISLPPPRKVTTRRWGNEMEINEMIVGDETKSGFGITFWLPPRQDSHAHPGGDDNMRRTLEKLRPQDIVLLRNVALASFRGKVHGQSLRRDMTTVQLLYRKKVDRHDDGGVYSSKDLASAECQDAQFKKARTVREWVLNFVGVTSLSKDAPGQRNSKDNEKGQGRRSPLPPDTQ